MAQTQQAQSAASLAATGAKVGSIIPGVGTVIGAVVGAVVGWLGAKPKPVRPTAQQVAECKTLLSEYMGYARQMPNEPLPMDMKMLKEINWCENAVYGGLMGLRDPRYFGIGIDTVLAPTAIALVKAVYNTPIGGTVNLGALSFKDPKGRTVKFSGYSFTNPQFISIKDLSDKYWLPALISMCKETAGKGAGGCEPYHVKEETKRWAYDFLAWAAREALPNISEADLKAASAVAATVPNTAASTVVQAVEQIIGRTVQSGETAALLTPATTPPTPPPATTTPPPVKIPTTPPASTLPTVSTPPSPSTGTNGDIATLISQMIAQGASQTDAFNSAVTALQQQGQPVTAVEKQAIATEVQAASVPWFRQPMVITGGVVAAFALFFLIRPVRRRRA